MHEACKTNNLAIADFVFSNSKNLNNLNSRWSSKQSISGEKLIISQHVQRRSGNPCGSCEWQYQCSRNTAILDKFSDLVIIFGQNFVTISYYFSPGFGGNSILHYAALSANVETVRFCLGQGIQADWYVSTSTKMITFTCLFFSSLNYEAETPLHLIAEVFSGMWTKIYF